MELLSSRVGLEGPDAESPSRFAWYDVSVSRRFISIFAGIIILLMVLPPLFDTFDTWDKTPEIPVVGHNTETTISVMAIEVGMGFAVAWSIVLLLRWLAEAFAPKLLDTPRPTQLGVRATDYLLLLFSPPRGLTSLRI
jgi:hypothetical protein